MITMLLRRIEALYTAAEDIITGGGYEGALDNWVFIVAAACAAAFVIDQAIWLLMFKPYKRWARMIRNFNRGADRVLDAMLSLAERAGWKKDGAASEDGGDGAEPAPEPDEDIRIFTPSAAAAPEPPRRGPVPVRAGSKALTPPERTPPGDWTGIPPSYEGVRWWEPAEKEQI